MTVDSSGRWRRDATNRGEGTIMVIVEFAWIDRQPDSQEGCREKMRPDYRASSCFADGACNSGPDVHTSKTSTTVVTYLSWYINATVLWLLPSEVLQWREKDAGANAIVSRKGSHVTGCSRNSKRD